MSEYSKKDIFDELRTGSHISIGHPMWTYIVENQEELSDYFSDLEIELLSSRVILFLQNK